MSNVIKADDSLIKMWKFKRYGLTSDNKVGVYYHTVMANSKDLAWDILTKTLIVQKIQGEIVDNN